MSNLPPGVSTSDLPECAPDPADGISDSDMLELVGPGDMLDYFTDGDGADVAANWCEDSDHSQIPEQIMRGFKRYFRARLLRSRMGKMVDAA